MSPTLFLLLSVWFLQQVPATCCCNTLLQHTAATHCYSNTLLQNTSCIMWYHQVYFFDSSYLVVTRNDQKMRVGSLNNSPLRGSCMLCWNLHLIFCKALWVREGSLLRGGSKGDPSHLKFNWQWRFLIRPRSFMVMEVRPLIHPCVWCVPLN